MVEFDPLAVDVLNELNERYDDHEIEAYATWEHEELAQVKKVYIVIYNFR